MKRIALLLAVVMCGGLSAQTTPKPLQCGKYQHIQHWAARCGPSPDMCDSESMVCEAVSICTPPPPDQCVPNLHTVTEREWQELMARLKALEPPKKKDPCVYNKGEIVSCTIMP